MTREEFNESAAALAVGALSATEQAACEAFLASLTAGDECHVVWGRAREAAALIPQALRPVRPSPQTWDRIVAQVGVDAAAARAPASSRLSWGWAVAAVAAVLFMWSFRDRSRLGAELEQATAELARTTETSAQVAATRVERDGCLAQLQEQNASFDLGREVVNLLEKGGTRLVALAAQGDMQASANAVVGSPGQSAFVMATGLMAKDGKDYQLWAIKGDKKHPAGLLQGDDNGRVMMKIDQGLLAQLPDALAVTMEPAGGMPQPTGPIVMVGAVGQ